MIRPIFLFIIGAALLGLGVIIGLQLQPSVQPHRAAPRPITFSQPTAQVHSRSAWQ
jgi:hypothetical protein